MAKISPVSIKYMIYSKFEAEGAVEKPDVIGAVFGQTEGLLGTDLEMRELQKEGKIGRIEVSLEPANGKTIGRIQIPSALDKTETTLIAAAIETIERIGPSNAKIEIEKIEDVRENKREYILERAKKLLEGIEEKMPKSREIAENIKIGARESKLREYGEDKLPSGDLNGNEIIVVEGRADVINLLRNGVENVIGMNGTILPEAIKELSYNKEITLFLDGDRGGKLIAKNVIGNARIDYVVFAPLGREVEELSGKEILLSLRKKIPSQEFLKSHKYIISEVKSRQEFSKSNEKENSNNYKEKQEETPEKAGENLEEKKEKLKELLAEVENSKSAIILNKKLEVIGRISVRGIFSFLNRAEKAYVIIADTATLNVIKAAEENNVANIVAKNFMNVENTRVNLISL